MKKKFLTFLFSAALVASMSTTAFAVDNVQSESAKPTKAIEEVQEKNNVSQVIEKINQSVVAIIGKNTKLKGQEELYSKIPITLQHGSGVVMSKEGRILTNNHVIDGVKDIYVITYDAKTYKAKLLYADEDIDLALLKINRTDLKPIKLANESKVKVGNEVIAIGTPLSVGYRNSASKGIVSGLNRPVERAYNYLQTDAAINPGNSGGPLVNMKGELVGINTLGSSAYQGMNFSIPVGNINYFLDHYNKFGKIKRCFTGINFEENWAALLGIPTTQGLKVVTVQKNAVVSSNEVKEGDMLEQINGKQVTSIAQYNEILKKYLPKDKVKFTFTRKNKKFDITVELKEMPN